MVTRIQLRRGTAAQWTSANPKLSAGEVGVETDTLKVKVGNGTTKWNALAYIPAAAGDLTGNTLAAGVVASSLTSVGTLGSLGVTGTVTAGGFSGPLTGNAATATKLATARAINGVNFDGSAAITVPAAAGTLSGDTLAAGVTASSLTSLGTIASLVATTADINGGTIDGATVGGATPAAGAFTTLTASSATTVAGLSLSDAVTNGGNVATIQKITQAAYDLLAPPNATTLYVIVD